MPRRSRALTTPALSVSDLSPGDLVNYFEGLPAEFAAVIVEILQKRVDVRLAAINARLQPPPLPGEGQGAPTAATARRRRGRGAVPLVAPVDTVGDADDADTE